MGAQLMSMALIIGLGVVALVIAVALAARSGGPHVTTIETRREREQEDGDDA